MPQSTRIHTATRPYPRPVPNPEARTHERTSRENEKEARRPFFASPPPHQPPPSAGLCVRGTRSVNQSAELATCERRAPHPHREPPLAEAWAKVQHVAWVVHFVGSSAAALHSPLSSRRALSTRPGAHTTGALTQSRREAQGSPTSAACGMDGYDRQGAVGSRV